MGVKRGSSGRHFKTKGRYLRVGEEGSDEITKDERVSRCHLPRVAYHQVYNV